MENTELILTVKMKTRHPVEGQFGNEYFNHNLLQPQSLP